jgi:hypothetical protein
MLLDNISEIQINLHAEAENKGFYSKSEQELEETANAFVESFCLKNDLASHTISPMCWSFESADHGIFDDGVIELKNINNDDTAFEYVDVSDAKVTAPE